MTAKTYSNTNYLVPKTKFKRGNELDDTINRAKHQ